MLLVWRCHLYLRMVHGIVGAGSLVIYMVTLVNKKSYINIQSSRILFSWMTLRNTHTKTLSLYPFIFVHKLCKYTSVIRSACVFHLLGTALGQVAPTVTTQLFSRLLIPSVIIRNHFALNIVSVIRFFRLFMFLNSLVYPVLYTFGITEFKALSLVCIVDHRYDFSS